MRTLISCLLLLALSACHQPSSSEPDCTETAMTQTEMNICSGDHARQTVKEFNRTYNDLMDKLSEEGQEKLQNAKEKWLIYRALQCEFNTHGSEGGSVHPMVINMCYDSMTHAYLQTLKHQLECVENNLPCGGQ